MKVPRNISGRVLERALIKDGFRLRAQRGSHRTYVKGRHVVTLATHHPSDTFRPKTLRRILEGTEWSVQDLKRLGLIK